MAEPAVFAVDEQDAVAVDAARWAALAAGVLEAEGVPRGSELSLLFVGVHEIAELNAEHMGNDGPTDVLAFPIDAGAELSDDEPAVLLGDVVVCPAVAAEQAAGHAGTLDDELALLVVHGVLHVLGHDHAEPGERQRMQARERELLEALHWTGPAPAGFRQAVEG